MGGHQRGQDCAVTEGKPFRPIPPDHHLVKAAHEVGRRTFKQQVGVMLPPDDGEFWPAYEKIGRLVLELDWLKNLRLSTEKNLQMIERGYSRMSIQWFYTLMNFLARRTLSARGRERRESPSHALAR